MKKLILTALIAVSLIGCKTTATTKTEAKAEVKQEIKADSSSEKKTAFDIKTIVADNKDLEVEILDNTFGEPDSTGKVYLTKSVKTKIINKGKTTTEVTNNSVVNEAAKKVIKSSEQAKTTDKTAQKESKLSITDYIVLFFILAIGVFAVIFYFKIIK